MADLVLRLQPDEAKAALDAVRYGSFHGADDLCAACASVLGKLRAALDSPSVEERVEYRICGTERRTGREWEGQARASRPTAGHVLQLREQNNNVREQSRTITTFSDGWTLTSPWTDLPDEGEG